MFAYNISAELVVSHGSETMIQWCGGTQAVIQTQAQLEK